MRTTISIADRLLEKAKRRAVDRGVSVSVVIEDALRGHLEATARAKVPPFRLYTVRGKLVNPDLNLDRTSNLISMDDEAAYGRR